ncbi:pyridoxal phosphate-dependent aminotransferase family protein [candidate division TA06 bacterium]|uniref:Pyridoxal phosphate-dependent aminotransferase family protein n=1 Tax=candidate division TA06 bacterium TaxID=2250710 RepID=A0A933I8A8_UNCT6|nr:pyridoxal phosphate-dependent aminotransferase family protein [candidate division TA06 bacterium]
MDIFKKCVDFTDARDAREAGLYPYFHPLSSAQEPEVIIDGQKMIMIGSNNYLGLTTHPRVKEAAIKAVEKFGTGCTGSRFLTGTLDMHNQLETKLAKFLNKPAALVFSTGMQTNLGVISCLGTKDDILITDKYDHASILDGCRLSYSMMRRFQHNDTYSLDRVLHGLGHNKGKMVIVDGIYSMEGDIADLPNIVKVCQKYGTRVLVDDAHALGVLGAHGRGTAEHFDLEQETDLIMGTFSKSFAAIGGVVAGDFEVIDYIKHFARSMIFSAALPPALTAAVSAAVDVLQQEPELLTRLWHNTDKMLKGFKELGYDTGSACTPIIPLMIGSREKAFALWKRLMAHGVFANPVIAPAVPEGREMIRTSFSAAHTEAQLDRVLEEFRTAGKELGLI